MHRWTARLLLLVMLVPAFGPLALAHASQPMGMHCMRQPAKTVMQCHHGMAVAPPSPETSFRAVDGCCPNHDCCRGMRTSEWAGPASNLRSRIRFLIEDAPGSRSAGLPSADVFKYDSARAPPLS